MMKALNLRLQPRGRVAGAVLLAMALAVVGLATAAPAFTEDSHGARSGYHRGDGNRGHVVSYGRHGDGDSGHRVTFLAPWMLRHGDGGPVRAPSL